MFDLRCILVVKLSDIGDLLTATPALRALRQSFPQAQIDVLVPPHSVPVLKGSPLVDDLLIFDKFAYDRPWEALRPSLLAAALRLGAALRQRHYDTLVLLHHLTTRWGALKYAALALSSGASRRVGLDNGRGWFLTHKAVDGGFGQRHEVEYWVEVVGLLRAKTDDLSLEVTVGEDDDEYAQNLLAGCQSPRLALHPGSGGYSLARRWSPAGFAQVADELVKRYGVRVVLVGGEEEVDIAAEVAGQMHHEPLNVAGRTTVRQLAAILDRCDLFVGNDSGVMHLATAVDTPVVAIFGPSNHRAWGAWPKGERNVVVRVDLPCSPCLYRGFEVGNRAGCATMECMRGITPRMVLEAVERLAVLNEGSWSKGIPSPSLG